jgi:hypothetical protein
VATLHGSPTWRADAASLYEASSASVSASCSVALVPRGSDDEPHPALTAKVQAIANTDASARLDALSQRTRHLDAERAAAHAVAQLEGVRAVPHEPEERQRAPSLRVVHSAARTELGRPLRVGRSSTAVLQGSIRQFHDHALAVASAPSNVCATRRLARFGMPS